MTQSTDSAKAPAVSTLLRIDRDSVIVAAREVNDLDVIDRRDVSVFRLLDEEWNALRRQLKVE